MELFGLTSTQLLILAGLGILLAALFLALRGAMKLTKSCLRVTVAGVVILLIVACVLMRVVGG
jgi:hypothetical protein